MAKKIKHVAYYRVSTQRQGRSGLGLEAQRRAVLDYLNGGAEVLAEHTEVESGARNDRPELAKALAACRVHSATLVIAKMDRLARNVAFISNLMESGVDFTAVDFPQANRLTIHVLAAVAEHERDMISQRTKAALAAAKARGVKLGRPENMTPSGRARGSRMGNAVKSARARSRAADLLPVMEELRAEGTVSLRGMAAALNERGVPAPRGGRWYPSSVKNALALAGGAS
jgi:DNA invertase Pin-like site-specific DNA recombinase